MVKWKTPFLYCYWAESNKKQERIIKTSKISKLC